MAEDKDFIDEAQQEAELRFGGQLSADELAHKFAGHDLEARIFHLKNLRGGDELSVAEAARRYEYEGALRNTHETLRKAGR